MISVCFIDYQDGPDLGSVSTAKHKHKKIQAQTSTEFPKHRTGVLVLEGPALGLCLRLACAWFKHSALALTLGGPALGLRLRLAALGVGLRLRCACAWGACA